MMVFENYLISRMDVIPLVCKFSCILSKYASLIFSLPPYTDSRGGTHRLQHSSHVGNHHSSSHRDGHSTRTKVHSIPGCPTVKDTTYHAMMHSGPEIEKKEST